MFEPRDGCAQPRDGGPEGVPGSGRRGGEARDIRPKGAEALQVRFDPTKVMTGSVRLATFDDRAGKVNTVYGSEDSFKITTPGCPGLFWIDQPHEIYDTNEKLL